VGNEEVSHIGKEESNSVHTRNRRKSMVIGHISLRNCFIKYYIALKKDGMFKVTGI
jgi:hypothetical protein